MKNLNVMQLAWKLHKQNDRLTNFGYCLKLAWKICKNAKVLIQNNVIKFYTKHIKNLKLYVSHRVEKGCIVIKNDIYNLNLFIYEFNKQIT